MTPECGAHSSRTENAPSRGALFGGNGEAEEDVVVGEGDAAEDGSARNGAGHVQPLKEGHLGLMCY